MTRTVDVFERFRVEGFIDFGFTAFLLRSPMMVGEMKSQARVSEVWGRRNFRLSRVCRVWGSVGPWCVMGLELSFIMGYPKP